MSMIRTKKTQPPYHPLYALWVRSFFPGLISGSIVTMAYLLLGILSLWDAVSLQPWQWIVARIILFMFLVYAFCLGLGLSLSVARDTDTNDLLLGVAGFGFCIFLGSVWILFTYVLAFGLFVGFVGALLYVGSVSNKPSLPTSSDAKEETGQCGICKQEGKYDICLACEQKYRGEIQRVRNQLHRARKAGTEATLTIAEWLGTLENFHYRCAYCQAGPYELIEHYIPISKGGGTTALNCVPACFRCNSQKSDNHPEKSVKQK